MEREIAAVAEASECRHTAWKGPKAEYFPEAWRDKLDALDRRLGYCFVLRQMILPLAECAGQAVEARVLIDNVGVAPIHRPYRFALRFRQGEVSHIVPLTQDIRRWLPDLTWFSEPIAVPAGLHGRETDVETAIIDPVTQRPVARFAIEGDVADGWHALTKMDLME